MMEYSKKFIQSSNVFGMVFFDDSTNSVDTQLQFEYFKFFKPINDFMVLICSII